MLEGVNSCINLQQIHDCLFRFRKNLETVDAAGMPLLTIYKTIEPLKAGRRNFLKRLGQWFCNLEVYGSFLKQSQPLIKCHSQSLEQMRKMI